MARKLVKTTVRETRKNHPEAKVEVLYVPGGGWNGHGWNALPESQCGEYRTDKVEWYGDTLCTIYAV